MLKSLLLIIAYLYKSSWKGSRPLNFKETLKTLELVIKTGEVPLIIGESGIGKTSLIKQLCRNEEYYLITIDANL